jgi:hypothetical protein
MDFLVAGVVCLGLILAAVLAVALTGFLLIPVGGVVSAILSARKQRLSERAAALLPPPAPLEPDPAVEALKADLKRQFAIEEMRTDA